MTTPRSRLGSTGEHHARLTLERAGLAWIESNWRCASGEIDLIMRDGDEVVFVEVKVRTGEYTGAAEGAISTAKARKLLASGEWYMADHPELGEPPWRIDLIAITINTRGVVQRISHLPNAVVFG